MLRRSVGRLFLRTIGFCFRLFCDFVVVFSDEKLAENFEN